MERVVLRSVCPEWPHRRPTRRCRQASAFLWSVDVTGPQPRTGIALLCALHPETWDTAAWHFQGLWAPRVPCQIGAGALCFVISAPLTPAVPAASRPHSPPPGPRRGAHTASHERGLPVHYKWAVPCVWTGHSRYIFAPHPRPRPSLATPTGTSQRATYTGPCGERLQRAPGACVSHASRDRAQPKRDAQRRMR